MRQARRHLALHKEWSYVATARSRICRLARKLADEYGTPDLGNVSDPLREAVFIILTQQTDIPRAREVHRVLEARYPTLSAVKAAHPTELADVLRPCGLHQRRARILQALLIEVERRTGTLSLDICRSMPDTGAERFLRTLPGMDRKSARCVMLYSLGRSVFPVDSNTFRFALRYGLLPSDSLYRRASVHDDLQSLIPPRVRHSLHVNLVVHGQHTCRPTNPRCDGCVLRTKCKTGGRTRSSLRQSSSEVE